MFSTNHSAECVINGYVVCISCCRLSQSSYWHGGRQENHKECAVPRLHIQRGLYIRTTAEPSGQVVPFLTTNLSSQVQSSGWMLETCFIHHLIAKQLCLISLALHLCRTENVKRPIYHLSQKKNKVFINSPNKLKQRCWISFTRHSHPYYKAINEHG